jgi:uncharacterized protein (TIGR03382 family)
MKKKAIALTPFLAARRRRNQRERGAKFGAPALLGLGAAAAAIILRRRKRTAAGFDASPSELGGTQPGAGANTDGSAADAPARGEGRPSTLEGDPAEAVSAAGVAGAGEGTVIPDTATDDPSVVEAEKAAAAEAGAIGGDVPDTPPSNEPDFAVDPSTRPVEEGAGSAYESFSERES